jgi:hypothetical protein
VPVKREWIKWIFAGIIGLIAVVILGLGAANKSKHAEELRLTVQDVGLLTDTYLSLLRSNPSPSMSNLLSEIGRQGLRLNLVSNGNYRIVSSPSIDAENYGTTPSAVIIEASNGMGSVVEGFADGSIAVTKEPKR